MKLTNIDMDLLRALVYVSNAQGFTKAAEKLFRTQSAISLQIKKLEQLTHKKLLERGKEIQLTPAGLKVYDYALKILKLNDELISSMANDSVPLYARIGLPEHHDAKLMETILNSTLPENAQCSFLSDGSENLSSMIDCHLLDIAFILQTELVGAAEITTVPLSWVSARNSSLHQDTHIALALPPEGSMIRSVAQKALVDNARRFTITCTSGDLTAIKTIILADKAIGVMPTRCVPQELSILKSGELPQLPEARLFMKISSQANPALNKLACEMIDTCARAVARTLSSSD